jgi:hypothetical protein
MERGKTERKYLSEGMNSCLDNETVGVGIYVKSKNFIHFKSKVSSLIAFMSIRK